MEVLSTPEFFLSLLLGWFQLNGGSLLCSCNIWFCPFCELPMGPLTSTLDRSLGRLSNGIWVPNYPERSFFPLPAQHWPSEFFLSLSIIQKERSWEVHHGTSLIVGWGENVAGCKLSCRGLCECPREMQQTEERSQLRGCEVLSDHVGYHTCCILAQFESQLLL